VIFLFEVYLDRKAEKFYIKCDEKLKNRLRILFTDLKDNPVPAKMYDLKKVENEKDTYRIRLSSYRAIYTIYWIEKEIRVTKIERRKSNTYDF